MHGKRHLYKIKRFIKACRVAKSLTQAELAFASNISLKTIQKVEKTGVITTDSLVILLTVLNRNALNRIIDSGFSIESNDFPMTDDKTLLKSLSIMSGNDKTIRRVKK